MKLWNSFVTIISFVEFNQIYRLKISNNGIKLYIKEKDEQLIPENIEIKKKAKKRKNCKSNNLC